ncbi:MAG: DUF4129 domain-containing protein [Thermofilum sp.]
MRRSTVLAMTFVSAALALASGASAARIEGEVDVSTALQILGVALLAMFSIGVTLNSSYIASVLRELFRRRPYSREAEDWGRVRSALLTQVLFLILIALALLLRREAETAGVEEVGGLPGAVQQNMTEQLSNATSAMLVSSAAGTGTIEQPLTALAAVLAVIPIVAIAVAMLRYKEEVYSRAESPAEVKEVAAVALERLRAGEDLRAVICSLYEDFCRILEKRGFTVTRYMTAREIMAGANTAFPWLPKEALTTLTNLFEKARYSDHAVTSEDKLAAEEALSEISGTLSREQVV